MDWLVFKVLEKVSEVAESEVRLVTGVNEDVKKLRSTFQTIRAVLEDAEKRQVREKAVKIWLDKLQNVAYDMEDVLDEWNTAILKSQIPEDDPSSSTLPSKVCSNLIQPTSMSIRRVVQRRDIADKIKELNERLQAISKEKDDFAFLVDLTRNHNELKTERQKTTSFVHVSQIRGRDQDKHTLVCMLLSENNHEELGIPIISIVGMGGIGKTTLAQVVYNHHDVNAYFQKKLWVCVSDPFDEMRIAKAILETLTGSPSSFSELNNVLDKIHESIVGKRFLLVLDDVWNEDEGKWQSLKNCLNSGSQGSKILVTTRKENVATLMGCTKIFHLRKLSKEDCWSLFSHIAFFGRADIERQSLEDIGRKIADRCQGLPLAAKALGGLLRFKRSREQWQKILDSNMWELDEAERGIFSPLLLSYYDLSSPLRQCFSYCAIFPKDHVIEKDLLIKLWMAQGFLGETQEGNDDMEIVGEEYFDNLATRSFFQEFEKDEDDGSITRCKMHDIVHDFAQLLRKVECCLMPLHAIEERRAEFYHENVRHLTLLRDNKRIGIFPDPTYNFKKLHSLFLVDSSYYNIVSALDASLQNLFDQLSCLRMLNLCCGLRNSIKELPQEIGELIHLRYLSLEGYYALCELPEALCDLCNLQTLNIRGCSNLRKLPHKMEKLINLRHLQNADTYWIASMPKGMRRLTSLRTLEEFVVKKGGDINESETSSSCSLADLGKLIHLRGKLLIKGLGNVGEASEAMEARLWTKAGLQELSLDFSDGYDDGADDEERQKRKEEEALLLQTLHPPPHLRTLRISRYKGPAFPTWTTSLTLLKSVELSYCDNLESLPPMGKLPSLESLSIWVMPKLKKVGEEFMGVGTKEGQTSTSSVDHNIAFFPNLKQLEFNFIRQWEEWEYETLVLRSRAGGNNSSSSNVPIIMPKLQRLSIYFCPMLKSLPSHLLRSRALQELEIKGNPILHRRFNKETGEDWSSISHIPIIKVTL